MNQINFECVTKSNEIIFNFVQIIFKISLLQLDFSYDFLFQRQIYTIKFYIYTLKDARFRAAPDLEALDTPYCSWRKKSRSGYFSIEADARSRRMAESVSDGSSKLCLKSPPFSTDNSLSR